MKTPETITVRELLQELQARAGGSFAGTIRDIEEACTAIAARTMGKSPASKPVTIGRQVLLCLAVREASIGTLRYVPARVEQVRSTGVYLSWQGEHALAYGELDFSYSASPKMNTWCWPEDARADRLNGLPFTLGERGGAA